LFYKFIYLLYNLLLFTIKSDEPATDSSTVAVAANSPNTANAVTNTESTSSAGVGGKEDDSSTKSPAAAADPPRSRMMAGGGVKRSATTNASASALPHVKRKTLKVDS
jgi:hypothetical protein